MPLLSSADAALVLASLPGVGPSTLRKLLKDSRPSELLENPPEALKGWEEKVNLEALRSQMEKLSIRLVETQKVSPSLLDLPDMPPWLFTRGPLDISAIFNSVAIVGTRNPSEYGKKFAYELAGYLAERAIPVVSGLALGIDAAAHRGALDSTGPTVGVLGTGVDVIYPQENKKLFEEIAKRGLLLSEFPLGKAPDRFCFPRRNRIITALASALVVVESDETGGAMITADIAQKLGRRLFALPGRIDQTSSRGPHKLIQQGASLITSPEDFYRQFANLPPPVQEEMFAEDEKSSKKEASTKTSPARKIKVSLPPEAEALSEGEALSLDELSTKSKTPIGKLSAMMMELEIQGLVTKRLDGKYEAN